MMFGLVFDAKMGGLEIRKQVYRIIRAAKYEVSVFHEKASRMKDKRGPTIILKLRLGRSEVLFSSFWEVVSEVNFLTSF